MRTFRVYEAQDYESYEACRCLEHDAFDLEYEAGYYASYILCRTHNQWWEASWDQGFKSWSRLNIERVPVYLFNGDKYRDLQREEGDD